MGPPAYLEALLARLRDRGLPRRDAETLEGYARRVAASAGDREAGDHCVAQALLLRYAALRYGDVGSGESLRADVRSWLASAAH